MCRVYVIMLSSNLFHPLISYHYVSLRYYYAARQVVDRLCMSSAFLFDRRHVLCSCFCYAGLFTLVARSLTLLAHSGCSLGLSVSVELAI